jgi:hypothetical protein
MRRSLFPSILPLAACAGAPPPAAPAALPLAVATSASTPAPTPTPPAPRYVAAFEELLRRIERDHVFPPRYVRDVGHPFREDVPRLRDEFERAAERTEALVALRHLQNSLRDGHCQLDPPADLPRRTLTLGVRTWVGGTASAPEVRVVEVVDPDAQPSVVPGDAVFSVDGTPLAAWVAAHPFETSFLSPDRWLADTLSRITVAELPWSTVREGDARVLGVRHEGATREVTFHFRRRFPEAMKPDMDHPPPMAKVDCDAGAPVDYGDYALAAMGVNVCIYQPRKPGRPRVPVVRYPSFLYSGSPAQSLRMVRVDHEVLGRDLRDADGVVLDAHDNHGGNNPFLFAGWFSAGPWDHMRVVARVVPGLDIASVSEGTFADQVQSYREAQQAGRTTAITRFLCAPARCDAVVPDATERVTRAPVALIVGPGCVSSCDTLALTWATFHLGPVLGMQPAHAYTVNRLPIHVAGPASEDLGRFRLALSQSEMREGVSIEGEPLALDWEAPSTFEARTTWVRRAVEEAKKRFTRR